MRNLVDNQLTPFFLTFFRFLQLFRKVRTNYKNNFQCALITYNLLPETTLGVNNLKKTLLETAYTGLKKENTIYHCKTNKTSLHHLESKNLTEASQAK